MIMNGNFEYLVLIFGGGGLVVNVKGGGPIGAQVVFDSENSGMEWQVIES